MLGLFRIAPVVCLALVIPGSAFAGICVDMHLRLDQRQPPAAIVSSMQAEASRIWAPYGVWLQWAPTPSSADCGEARPSFVVQFDRRTEPGAWSKGILGSTHLAPGAIDHVAIQIDREATRALLGSANVGQLARLLGRPSFGPDDEGRALGRVLAHEVGHVLLAVRDHQRRGLMRAAFGVEDLLEQRRPFYALSPPEVARLNQREGALVTTVKSPAASSVLTLATRARTRLASSDLSRALARPPSAANASRA